MLFCIENIEIAAMNDLFEFLKIVLPSLVIMIVVYIMMREFTKHNTKQFNYLRDEQDLQKIKLKKHDKSNADKFSIPLKFQAYERMALFLERINPSNLITRVLKPKMKVSMLHSILLSTIRDEYEHNMSQQLYLSDTTWELVKNAKEEIVSQVNKSAAAFKSDEDAGKFAQEIITSIFSKKDNPIEKALTGLKEDIRDNFS